VILCWRLKGQGLGFRCLDAFPAVQIILQIHIQSRTWIFPTIPRILSVSTLVRGQVTTLAVWESGLEGFCCHPTGSLLSGGTPPIVWAALLWPAVGPWGLAAILQVREVLATTPPPPPRVGQTWKCGTAKLDLVFIQSSPPPQNSGLVGMLDSLSNMWLSATCRDL